MHADTANAVMDRPDPSFAEASTGDVFLESRSMRIWIQARGPWRHVLACTHWVAAALTAGAACAAADAPALTTAQRALAAQVRQLGDAGQRPWAIVDKQAATMVVFHSDGTPAGSTPVLLGRARGDHSMPGVGERTQAGRLLPADATTPAGRYASAPGFNHTGERVVWVDPEAAFAIHRLRPGPTQVARQRALQGSQADARRLSAGCVVVPVAFYESVVQPLLGQRAGVVYVLPDSGAWRELAAGVSQRALRSGL
jgi:hypothetical protein